MKDRYIVTGAAGHVGSTILRGLRDRSDIEIYALVRAGGTKAKINSENIHYVIGNVKDRESLEGLFEGAEGDIYFIHCAAIISIQRKVSKEIYDVNVKGVDSVIKALTNEDIKAYIDLKNYKPGEYDVPVKVEGTDSRVEYLSKKTKVRIRVVEK